ncbi:DNA cytosine methyltransferase [uncultured Pseudacidovorax sp.]|uniref:DNA cytosine methyltransferase n=1 Tax=uncultured Pseudacidovorax sp. TaxID=679313 RepID=UPI0025D5DDD6|nr:DNA cytosine methyltransferase [uncultured Pseudacidovorax sp.]
MRFLSVCSGIEAASVAWGQLGWKAVAFSEIEPFPCAVLAHHYPDTPNWGDMTKFKDWPDAAVDLLCGGTPCQSFSVAGLRKGLDDPRGNLMLTFGAIAAKYRPRWLVWENVPGVLSSNGGRDFGAFLWMLGQLGYGFAYRVLDAQHFGVPQRRRRVFVVGCLGDWRRAAAVLFERHSLSGHPAPRRDARAGTPVGALAGTSPGGGWRVGADEAAAGQLVAFGGNNRSGPIDVAAGLNAKGGAGRMDFDSETFVARTLRSAGFDASEDSAGRGQPIVAQALASQDQGHPKNQVLAMRESGPGWWMQDEVAGTLRAEGEDRPSRPSHVIKQNQMQVRRLTPMECERLQGFPDGYTAITVRGKPAADGPRYKALGNSWAIPCVRWIGERINAVEALALQDAA